MCRAGGRCTSYDPGHALHLVQSRLAAATPAQWEDAIVVAIAGATVTVRRLADGAESRLENAAGASDAVRVGDPVAVHSRYRVLAAGRLRFNVRETG